MFDPYKGLMSEEDLQAMLAEVEHMGELENIGAGLPALLDQMTPVQRATFEFIESLIKFVESLKGTLGSESIGLTLVVVVKMVKALQEEAAQKILEVPDETLREGLRQYLEPFAEQFAKLTSL